MSLNDLIVRIFLNFHHVISSIIPQSLPRTFNFKLIPSLLHPFSISHDLPSQTYKLDYHLFIYLQTFPISLF